MKIKLDILRYRHELRTTHYYKELKSSSVGIRLITQMMLHLTIG